MIFLNGGTYPNRKRQSENIRRMGEFNHWSELAARTNFPESTIRYCVNLYHKTNQLFPKCGSPTKITSNEKNQIAQSVEGNCETTLSQIGSKFSYSKSTIYKVLNDPLLNTKRKLQQYTKTQKCELDDEQIQNRILFCSIWYSSIVSFFRAHFFLKFFSSFSLSFFVFRSGSY